MLALGCGSLPLSSSLFPPHLDGSSRQGGYGSNLDKPADELERARLDAQRALAELSSAGTQRIVKAGHNMHLEAPDIVVQAIRDIVNAVRR